jgi:hypothetical protein
MAPLFGRISVKSNKAPEASGSGCFVQLCFTAVATLLAWLFPQGRAIGGCNWSAD